MILSQKIDKMGWILTRQGKAGFYISISGHESSIVWSLDAIDKDDWVMPYYRTQPAFHVWGTRLEELLGQIQATNSDPNRGGQISGHFGKRGV